ncbi:Oidioi.mRNA.OKI2018_I69.chr2.g7872.t1.cds [Oikopleura dioica]|uniref:Oidioi.mRNA.OKI2018_I69.chr2.g7872.t1.cds n=1 Tax=Oikopleura dioica TaxID=34765 RepID=A0ABN7TE80_OIKDI|nr:Oidioi.mRNA.OKI2018_I69.chr2.g7872.t1.cds [Oikopleura dioica]
MRRVNARKDFARQVSNTSSNFVESIADSETFNMPRPGRRNGNTQSRREEVSQIAETEFDSSPPARGIRAARNDDSISQIAETEFDEPTNPQINRSKKRERSPSPEEPYSYGTLSVTQSSKHQSTQSSKRKYSQQTTLQAPQTSSSNTARNSRFSRRVDNVCGSVKINIASGFHCGYEANPDGYKIFDEFLEKSSKGRQRADVAIIAGNLFNNSQNHFSSIQRITRSLNKNIYRKSLITDVEIIQTPKTGCPDIVQCPKMPVLMIGGRCDHTMRERHGNAARQTYQSPVAIFEASGIAQSLDDTKLCLEEEWTYAPTVVHQDGLYVAIYGISYVAKTYLQQLGKAKFVKPVIPEGAVCKTMLVLANSMEKPPVKLAELASGFDVVVWGGENGPSKVQSPNGNWTISTGEALLRYVHEANLDHKEFQQITFTPHDIIVESHEFTQARHLLLGEVVLNDYIGVFNTKEEYEEEFDKAISENSENILRDYPAGTFPQPAMILKVDLKRPGGQEPLGAINSVFAGQQFCDRVWNWKSCIRYVKDKKTKKEEEKHGLITEPLMDSNRHIISEVLEEKISEQGIENLTGKIGKDIADAYGIGDTQSILDVCEWMKEAMIEESKKIKEKQSRPVVDEAVRTLGTVLKDKLEKDGSNTIVYARRELNKGTKSKKKTTTTKGRTKSSKSKTVVISDDEEDEEIRNPFCSSSEEDEVITQSTSRSKRSRR